MSEQRSAEEFIQIEYCPLAVVNCLFDDPHSPASHDGRNAGPWSIGGSRPWR